MAKFSYAREAGEILLNIVALGLLLALVSLAGTIAAAFKIGAIYPIF